MTELLVWPQIMVRLGFTGFHMKTGPTFKAYISPGITIRINLINVRFHVTQIVMLSLMLYAYAHDAVVVKEVLKDCCYAII